MVDLNAENQRRKLKTHSSLEDGPSDERQQQRQKHKQQQLTCGPTPETVDRTKEIHISNNLNKLIINPEDPPIPLFVESRQPGDSPPTSTIADSNADLGSTTSPTPPPKRRSLLVVQEHETTTSTNPNFSLELIPVSATDNLQPTGSNMPPASVPLQNMEQMTLVEKVQIKQVSAAHPPKETKEIVSDYDNGATLLYKYLEGSHWDQALARCRTHPKEVRTWVMRRDPALAHRVRWKLLPLHAVIIFQGPLSLVQTMVEIHPQGVGQPDDQGMLPLHLAFRHQPNVVELLLTAYPQAVQVHDSKGKTPIGHATREMSSTSSTGSDEMKKLFSGRLVRVYADAVLKVDREQREKAHETALSDERTKFEKQIMSLKKLYEDNIAQILRRQKLHLPPPQRVTEMDNDETPGPMSPLAIQTSTSEQQEKKIQILSGANQVAATLNSELKEEILHLENELGTAKSQVEMLDTLLGAQRGYNEEILVSLQEMADEHKQLSHMVSRQQEELEAAHAMRAQLLRTLTEQEDEDKHQILKTTGQTLVQHANQLQCKIVDLLDKSPNPVHSVVRKDIIPLQPEQQQQQEQQQKTSSQQQHPELEHRPPNVVTADDDISGITENSSF